MSAPIGHNNPPEEIERAGNWIAISRDLIEHHIVGAGRRVTPADRNSSLCFNRMEAWLDLLCMANFSERSVDLRGATLILTPGQTLVGRAHLAKRWNWTEKTVRGFLERLERELMITLACETIKNSQNPGSNREATGNELGHKKGHLPNVATICNWSKFQGSTSAEGPAKSPPKGQPRASQGPHYNKGTREQDSIPSDLQSEGDRDNNSSRAKNARAGSGKGSRNFIRSSWLPADKPDGSQGLLFENGRLSVVNGCRFSLQQDFPDIDIDGACNKAAAEIVATQRKERCELSHMDCLTILRKHCQWEVDYRKKIASQSFSKPSGKRDFLSGLTPEQRALVDAQRSAKQGAH